MFIFGAGYLALMVVGFACVCLWFVSLLICDVSFCAGVRWVMCCG